MAKRTVTLSSYNSNSEYIFYHYKDYVLSRQKDNSYMKRATNEVNSVKSSSNWENDVPKEEIEFLKTYFQLLQNTMKGKTSFSQAAIDEAMKRLLGNITQQIDKDRIKIIPETIRAIVEGRREFTVIKNTYKEESWNNNTKIHQLSQDINNKENINSLLKLIKSFAGEGNVCPGLGASLPNEAQINQYREKALQLRSILKRLKKGKGSVNFKTFSELMGVVFKQLWSDQALANKISGEYFEIVTQVLSDMINNGIGTIEDVALKQIRDSFAAFSSTSSFGMTKIGSEHYYEKNTSDWFKTIEQYSKKQPGGGKWITETKEINGIEYSVMADTKGRTNFLQGKTDIDVTLTLKPSSTISNIGLSLKNASASSKDIRVAESSLIILLRNFPSLLGEVSNAFAKRQAGKGNVNPGNYDDVAEGLGALRNQSFKLLRLGLAYGAIAGGTFIDENGKQISNVKYLIVNHGSSSENSIYILPLAYILSEIERTSGYDRAYYLKVTSDSKSSNLMSNVKTFSGWAKTAMISKYVGDNKKSDVHAALSRNKQFYVDLHAKKLKVSLQTSLLKKDFKV